MVSRTLRTKAASIGIVIDRASGTVVRIMNPDFEEELDLHPIAAGEFMIRTNKRDHGISSRRNAMAFVDVAKILAMFESAP